MKKMRSMLPEIREKILLNHKEKRGSLCQDDLENLKEWKFSANVADDKYLVREGHKELLSLAHRYQRRFPKLLERPFNNESYKVYVESKICNLKDDGSFQFQYTDSERTNSSAIAFAMGLFGKSDYLNVHYHQPPAEDVILRVSANSVSDLKYRIMKTNFSSFTNCATNGKKRWTIILLPL